ncbi:MAG: right-handed parallel beta-helix repeat-containing protein [Verrucomicrobiales bacterium]
MSNVKNFGAIGDGEADDTEAIRHALSQGDGELDFPRGNYRISETIEILLDETGRLGIDGSNGTATVIMTGEGPAFRIIGTHGGTGDPGSSKPNIWEKQRMPTVRNIEVTATNKKADGFELIETMQATFSGVLIRQVRNGIRLHKRNRNVLINDCHIYNNLGAGIFMDELNLHQINICGNHISYNRLGGIRIEKSEIRNLQITGNDIEYNNHRAFGTEPEITAEILIDTTAEKSTVNEVTIASNTIQATPSPGGCNIRMNNKSREDRPPGLITISGNVIGNQENGVHLTACYGIAISGNTIYSAENRNLLLEQCSDVNVTGNVFRRHTPKMHTGVRVVDSTDCVFSGCSFRDESEEGQKNGASLLELADCRRISVQGCQLIDGAPWGLDAQQCSEVNVSACIFGGDLVAKRGEGAIQFHGKGQKNLVSSCTIEGKVKLDPASGVKVADSNS